MPDVGTEGSTTYIQIVLFDGLENSTEFWISIEITAPEEPLINTLVSENVQVVSILINIES